MENSATNTPIQRRCVLVCQHRSCLRNGSEAVLTAFQTLELSSIVASGSDCMGQCASGPTVRVMPDGVWYCRITPGDVPLIAEQHFQMNKPVEALLHSRFHPKPDAFMAP